MSEPYKIGSLVQHNTTNTIYLISNVVLVAGWNELAPGWNELAPKNLVVHSYILILISDSDHYYERMKINVKLWRVYKETLNNHFTILSE